MNKLNIKAKILLLFLIVSAIIFPIISYRFKIYFTVSILYSLCSIVLATVIIVLSIKTAKFLSLIEKENIKIEEDFQQKKYENGKIVNLSFKEYEHLIKKGFVPIGKDKTEIIELKKDEQWQ